MKTIREVRFKAWDTETKKWLWTGFENFLGESHSDKPIAERTGNLILNSDYSGLGTRVIFVQNTGLTDRNGTEIYEGDFIRLHEYGEDVYKEVVFHNGCFCIHGFNWDRKTAEVIGNIYNNPELLG